MRSPNQSECTEEPVVTRSSLSSFYLSSKHRPSAFFLRLSCTWAVTDLRGGHIATRRNSAIASHSCVLLVVSLFALSPRPTLAPNCHSSNEGRMDSCALPGGIGGTHSRPGLTTPIGDYELNSPFAGEREEPSTRAREDHRARPLLLLRPEMCPLAMHLYISPQPTLQPIFTMSSFLSFLWFLRSDLSLGNGVWGVYICP